MTESPKGPGHKDFARIVGDERDAIRTAIATYVETGLVFHDGRTYSWDYRLQNWQQEIT